MSEAQKEAREAAAEYIHKKRPEWHDRGVGIVQGSHYRKVMECDAPGTATVLGRVRPSCSRSRTERSRR